MPTKPITHEQSIGQSRLTERMRNERRKPFKSVYNSTQWIALREWAMATYPVCRACGVAPAEDLDHIRPLAAGGAPYDRDNVQTLCGPCHSAKTQRETKHI